MKQELKLEWTTRRGGYGDQKVQHTEGDDVFNLSAIDGRWSIDFRPTGKEFYRHFHMGGNSGTNAAACDAAESALQRWLDGETLRARVEELEGIIRRLRERSRHQEGDEIDLLFRSAFAPLSTRGAYLRN